MKTKATRIFLFFLCLLVLLLESKSWAVQVNGYVLLEDEADHSGVDVEIERTYPHFVFYVTTTSNEGFFTKNVDEGIFDITFSKEGFQTLKLEDVELYSDSTLQTDTLKKPLVSWNKALCDNMNKKISIYPNPASDYISIQGTDALDTKELKIIDIYGRAILISSENSHSSKIDISALKHGVYFIIISTPNGIIARRFLKY